jgi:hypothetical protein
MNAAKTPPVAPPTMPTRMAMPIASSTPISAGTTTPIVRSPMMVTKARANQAAAHTTPFFTAPVRRRTMLLAIIGAS